MRIIHANVFDGERFHADWQVRITDGTVTAAGKEIGETAGEEVLDLAGDTLLPGFVDVHIHGSAGKDAMRGEDDVRAMSRVLAESGVAAFCPTTMSAGAEATKQALAGIRRVMEAPERGGARVLGAHMEAPFPDGPCGRKAGNGPADHPGAGAEGQRGFHPLGGRARNPCIHRAYGRGRGNGAPGCGMRRGPCDASVQRPDAAASPQTGRAGRGADRQPARL